jgi:very-short-patch-repair endonuclease
MKGRKVSGRVKDHNKEIIYKAIYRANDMRTYPSKLEERMMEILDNHGIWYESQKIFYIYDDDGWIRRYFIADFFIPDRNIIIEVDGKFHDRHRQKDRDRTRIIQESYPDVQVLRYTWNDLSDDDVMRDLLWLIR